MPFGCSIYLLGFLYIKKTNKREKTTKKKKNLEWQDWKRACKKKKKKLENKKFSNEINPNTFIILR